MEDSVGDMVFLNRCLKDDEFNSFISSLSKPFGDRKKFKKFCRTWTIFYSDGSKEALKISEYLRENFPQPYMTNTSELGIFLDVIGLGLRETIKGPEKIKLYADIVKSYKERHESPEAPFAYNTRPLF